MIAISPTVFPEFITFTEAFDRWYDSLDSDKRELVDSINDATYYITEPEEYLSFIDMLDEDFGITSAMDFEDKFVREFEDYGNNALAEFAEELCTDSEYLYRLPSFIANHIDWQAVWDCELRYDYTEIQFRENTYLFHNY